MIDPLLSSAGPAALLTDHLDPHTARLDTDGQPVHVEYAWFSTAELLAEDGALLRQQHTRLVEAVDTPPAAAAKYLAGWYGGWLAESVGFVYAMAGAGALTDTSVRWRQHPEGWIDRVDIASCSMAVASDHPWAHRTDVVVLADDAAVRHATVAALTDLLSPVLAVCRSTARVGWNSLWAEVADGIGMALAFTPRLPQAPLAAAPLRELLDTPSAPWKARPDLWVATTETGPFAMGRKGGCCLAYTADREPPDPTDPDLDSYHRAYLQRFPTAPDTPNYCSTCCFRKLEDVEARQRFWLAHRGCTAPVDS